uniref:PAS domain-containing protein n=3 Tax=Flavobacterium sp. TaxID=239 RepID=UPI004049DBBC
MLQLKTKQSKLAIRLKQTFCLIGVAFVFVFFATVRYQQEVKFQKEKLAENLFEAKTDIEDKFKAYENICIDLALSQLYSENMESFNALAQKAQTQFPEIEMFSTAPKGIQKNIFPVKGFENEIGYHYLLPNLNPLLEIDAKKAIKTKKLIFSYPIAYSENNYYTIGFYPVFKNNVFWGFITIKLKLESFLELPTFEKNKNASTELVFAKANALKNETDFFFQESNSLKENRFEKTAIFNQNWQLYIIDFDEVTILKACAFDLFLITILGLISLIWIKNRLTNRTLLDESNQIKANDFAPKPINEIQSKEIIQTVLKKDETSEISPERTNTKIEKQEIEIIPEQVENTINEPKILALDNEINETIANIISHEKFSEVIINKAAIGILKVAYPSLKIKVVNAYFAEMLGYSVEDLIDVTTPELSIQIDNDLRKEDFDRLISNEISSFDMEKRYVHKNGTPIWCRITVSGIMNNDTEFDSYVVIVKNINESKKNELLSQQNQKRYESLFKDSPIPMLEQDFSEVKMYLDSLDLPTQNIILLTNYFSTQKRVVHECLKRLKIIGINNALLKLLQIENENTLQEQLNQFLLPDSKNTFIKQLITIALNKKTFKAQSKLKLPSGEQKIVESNWKVMRGFEKTYKRVLITTEDITDRMQNDIKVKKSEERVVSLINTIEGIVWERAKDRFTFSYLSDKITDILGFEKEAWIEKSDLWKESIYEKDRETTINSFYEKTYSHNSFVLEYRIVAKNGQIIWIRDYVNVIKPNGYIDSIRGIMIDITQIKKTEKNLNETLDVVMDQNKRLLNFSHIVSHNLRSHTSNILAINHLLDLADTIEEKEEYFLLIKNIAEELNFTLANLNDLTNKEAGINIEKDEVEVHEFVEKTLVNLKNLINEKKAHIHNKIPRSVSIYFNKSYLENVLSHIVTNSLQFSHPERTPIIHLTHSQDEKNHVFKISDNGLGIELNDNKEKVFQMKRVFHKHLSNQGLGLFITKTQIETMGGRIDVESEVDKGTSIIIKMPI